MKDNFIGSWKIETFSPLGKDYYILTVHSNFKATIHEMRGKIDFDESNFLSNSFNLLGKTETPTRSTVIMYGDLKDNKIIGKIEVFPYCTVDFEGVKNA